MSWKRTLENLIISESPLTSQKDLENGIQGSNGSDMQIITEADVVWWLGVVCTSGMHTPIKKIESLKKVGTYT